MGLDITAYEKVTLIKPYPEITHQDWETPPEDVLQLIQENGFEDWSDGLPDGFYKTGGETLGERVGSYFGYSFFREPIARQMCLLAGITEKDVPPDREHGEHLRYTLFLATATNQSLQELPFWDMIVFSDCGGFIGPETSARLYPDFVKYLDVAPSWYPENQDNMRKYNLMLSAFRLAANSGVVTYG